MPPRRLKDYQLEEMRQQLDWAHTLEQKHLPKPQQETLIKFVLLVNAFEAWLIRYGPAKDDVIEAICTDVTNTKWFQENSYDHFGQFGRFFVDNFQAPPEKSAPGKVKLDFGKLRLDGNQDMVTDTLEKFAAGKSEDNLLYVYMILVYYYRNKFFHGEKFWLEIPTQIDRFEQIVELLFKLLRDMIENKFEGLNHKYPIDQHLGRRP
jgi:hypothetical protein